MSYTFQTFVSSNHITAAEMNQIETNIQQHRHGSNGLSGSTPELLSITNSGVLQAATGSAAVWTSSRHGTGIYSIVHSLQLANGYELGIQAWAVSSVTEIVHAVVGSLSSNGFCIALDKWPVNTFGVLPVATDRELMVAAHV